ncbi:hypothetical protein FGB62_434g01 [Gracilaria domingensis]|nr:hypothetical protein FGB62_434g01 [Gracilaria domingensis]
MNAKDRHECSPSGFEYIEYDATTDTTFELPVDFLNSALIGKDDIKKEWGFRRGSGSALVSQFTLVNGRLIPFVSTVERSSRPSPITPSRSRSYMYKVVKCAHRDTKDNSSRPCMARAKLKFWIVPAEDIVRAGISFRRVHVIWDKLENGSVIPCIHVKGAAARGVVRKAERTRLMETTTMPSHMTMKSISSSDNALKQLLTGNRTGLLISQGAAHKAKTRGRNEVFEPDGDVWLDLRRAQHDSWYVHDKDGFVDLPIDGKLKNFLGSVHDLEAIDNGGFSRLTLFTAVSFEIHRRLLETRGENAQVVLMDATQFRERELLVSVKSNFVLRSLSRGTKLRYSADKCRVWVKLLHTFLVLRLPTGTQRNRTTQPYVCAEHISIERTAEEMVKFLETYFKRLESYIGVNAYPSFFVSTEDKAFTAAATWVFNRMYVSEYGAVMMLSSQRQDASIRIESVRTILVHCSLHKARNLRDYIQELARQRNEKKDSEMYSSLNHFLQQLFSFLRSASAYEELCHRTGVVACILSSECFPYVPPGNIGKAHVIASPEECIERGERELWRGLTPSNRPPFLSKSVHRVRYESRLGKEQLNSELEVLLREELEAEDKEAHKVGCSSSGEVAANRVLASRDTMLKEKGVQLFSYAKFHSFVAYESTLSVDGVDRLLIRFRCPFLSGFGYGSGGFKIVCKLRDVDRKGTRSPLWAKGRTLDFFRNSVLTNALFLCDALTSRPPLTHNTSVKVAIRNRKHVDEIGLLMKTCAKGMSLPEYVGRRSKWIEHKNVLQLSLMISGDLSGRRHIPLPDNHLLRRRKKSRLTDIARKCNVDVTNQKTSLIFFQNHNESDKPFGNCSEAGDDREAYLPSTQLRLSQERRAESIWRSTRGGSFVPPRRNWKKFCPLLDYQTNL